MEDQTFFTKLEISEKVVNQIQGDNISTICEIQRLICRHFLSLFDCDAKRERKPRQEKKEKNTLASPCGPCLFRLRMWNLHLHNAFAVRMREPVSLAGPMGSGGWVFAIWNL